MKTIDIKGKDYVMVNERIKHFWSERDPNWGIHTEFVELSEQRCVMKASIIKPNGAVISTGHAYEIADSSFINKTSYIENCETSAIGRALGNLGIGIDTSIASAEEVGNAVKQQEKGKSKPKSLITDAKKKNLFATGGVQGSDESEVIDICNWKKKGKLITPEEADDIITNFASIKNQYLDFLAKQTEAT